MTFPGTKPYILAINFLKYGLALQFRRIGILSATYSTPEVSLN
ncbi:18678_t:CDS:2 [Gigaspora rosea]|nr:18678_t:CDS:2 [Gigaspora rosea]